MQAQKPRWRIFLLGMAGLSLLSGLWAGLIGALAILLFWSWRLGAPGSPAAAVPAQPKQIQTQYRKGYK